MVLHTEMICNRTTVCRKKRAAYESGSCNRAAYTAKPSFVHVQEGGFIDASSEGKNAWDTALQDFVPKIVDVVQLSGPSTSRKPCRDFEMPWTRSSSTWGIP